MGAYTVISETAFNEFQLDAGILLTEFNPATPGTVDKTKIVCATTGGISINAVPSFSDLGEDVDNCPNNMKELMHLDSWDCNIGFTALSITEEVLALSLGCADATASSHKIVPRRDLEQTDFKEIWWVGDLADGGYVAVKLLNALSTSGLALQTTKNGKGQLSCTLTGHVSINAQNTMPMEFYVIPGTGA